MVMPKRGENIYKRKDGRWEGRYFKTDEHQNKQYGYVYAKTYREVKEKLAQVKEQVQTEESCFVQKTETRFVNIAKEWLYVSEKKYIDRNDFLSEREYAAGTAVRLTKQTLCSFLFYDTIKEERR